MEKITLVVVDDHPIFRQGVVDTFSYEPDFSVVGQAATGSTGLDMIRQLRPRVAIVDVNLPEMNGQQITRQVVTEKLPTRVVLLTAYDDIEQRIHAMSAGASAFCSKDVRPDKLVDTIRRVAAGSIVLGEEEMDQSGLERWLEGQMHQAIRLYSDPGEPYQPLTGREMEVLTYLTRGLSNKEIAMSLKISQQTVKNHVTAIFRKLGVDDRTQATIYALQRGWVRLYEEDSLSEE